MTYKEIVDRVKDIVFRHKQLADFGYGSLSDIKTRSQNDTGDGSATQADYPYVFLNPTSHTRTGQSITYRFNMIVMEMVPEADYLDGQSVCQQYIDDILSELRFGYTDQVDLTLNVTLTPFKERFQDTVAGMTATLEVVVPIALNQCIAPFEQLLTTLTAGPSTKDYNSPSAGSRNIVPQFEIPEAPAVYRIKGTVKLSLNRALTDDAAPYNVPYISILQDADEPRFLADIEFDGTKVNEVQTVEFDYTFTLEDVPPDNNDLFFSFGYTTGDGTYPDGITPIQEYDGAIDLISANIEVFS